MSKKEQRLEELRRELIDQLQVLTDNAKCRDYYDRSISQVADKMIETKKAISKIERSTAHIMRDFMDA